MDPLDVVTLTRALVDIDSTTGIEGDTGAWLAAYLAGRGFTVTEQHVDETRFNVFAAPGGGVPPGVVLSTHFDCVPPFFPSRIEADRLYGRGTCDAKGILAAQITAAERLRAAGESRFALLFVVGEERGSDGAALANAEPPGSRYLINGEPTDNVLGLSTRGVLRLKLHASGRAAHSSYPELGESAIEKLIDALVMLRSIELPSDPRSGRTFYTVGVIEGGVAPNVVPAHARGGGPVPHRGYGRGRARVPGSPRVARSHRARARGAARHADDRAGVRHGELSVHDGHSTACTMGKAAAVRTWIGVRGAHR